MNVRIVTVCLAISILGHLPTLAPAQLRPRPQQAQPLADPPDPRQLVNPPESEAAAPAPPVLPAPAPPAPAPAGIDAGSIQRGSPLGGQSDPELNPDPPPEPVEPLTTPELPDPRLPTPPGPAPLTLDPQMPSRPARTAGDSSNHSDAAGSRLAKTTPSISIETLGPSRINVGDPAELTLLVSNTGAVAAEALQLFVALPENAELTGSRPAAVQESAEVLRFDLGNLPAESARKVQLNVVPRRTGSLDLSTTVRFAASSLVSLQACQPQLVLSCQGPPEADFGTPVTFKLTVRNTGDGTARDVRVTTEVLEPAGAPAQDPVVIGALEPGKSQEVQFDASAAGPGSLALRFTALGAGQVEATAETRLRVRRAMIEVVNEGPRVNYLGREGQYEIRLSNPGDAAAENVRVVQSLPAGLQLLVVDRQVRHGPNRSTIVWDLDRLPAGAQEVLLYKVRTIAEGDQLQETVAHAAGGLEAQTRQLTAVISRPKINVALTNADGPLAVNREATFDLVLQNVGTKAATVRAKVELPPGLTAVATPGCQPTETGLALTPQSLEPGGEAKLQFRAVGRQAGDHVVRVTLETEGLPHVLSTEESVFFYDTTTSSRISQRPPPQPLRGAASNPEATP